MIFYNPQIMTNEKELFLYLVSNPKPFTRYENHEAALQIQLHELVERAIQNKENPIALIEFYLGITYNEGHTVADMANFIANSGQMRHALHQLKENWAELDDSLPGESLRFGGTSKEQAIQTFTQIALQTYLEALSGIYEN